MGFYVILFDFFTSFLFIFLIFFLLNNFFDEKLNFLI